LVSAEKETVELRHSTKMDTVAALLIICLVASSLERVGTDNVSADRSRSAGGRGGRSDVEAAAAGRERNHRDRIKFGYANNEEDLADSSWLEDSPFIPTDVQDCYNDTLLEMMDLERFRNSKSEHITL